MDFVGEIISGVFTLLVFLLEARMDSVRKQAGKACCCSSKGVEIRSEDERRESAAFAGTAIAVERGETNGEMITAREKAKNTQEKARRFCP